MRHFSVCVCCVIFLFLLNLKFEASKQFCGVEFVVIGVMDWVKSLYFLVGALHQLVVSDHRIGSPQTSSIFSVDSGVRRGEEKRKLIFLNREKRSPRQLIAWRLVIAMDVLHVNKSCPAFPVKRPPYQTYVGAGIPLQLSPCCWPSLSPGDFYPPFLNKNRKKKNNKNGWLIVPWITAHVEDCPSGYQNFSFRQKVVSGRLCMGIILTFAKRNKEDERSDFQSFRTRGHVCSIIVGSV